MGILSLCDGLGKHSGSGCLEVLSLEQCGIGQIGVEAFAKFFLNEKCILTHLNLKGNHQAGMMSIASLLRALKGSAGVGASTIVGVNLHDTFKAVDREHEIEFQ